MENHPRLLAVPHDRGSPPESGLGPWRRGRRRQQCRIGPGLVFVDDDVILHRSVGGGDGQHLLRPIVGWRVDAARCRSPEPALVLLFKALPDFLISRSSAGSASELE